MSITSFVWVKFLYSVFRVSSNEPDGRLARSVESSCHSSTSDTGNTVAPLPFWQRLGPLTRAGQAYARAQRARPWATQLASSLFIYLCADISAQRLGGRGEHDLERTGRSLVIGGAAAIPGYTW
ncbi:Uu.00g136850.m01.CDS01 [Anthostomella pinea]|uniref:Uu.00g136850.m01.CDS01 n=1 Tax=Anthostomella pinea TaxID=933095 RepID=A0AAI8YL65_9PEZI|nr:Uu.00g136850.m01.CDS01 [Anthostomella pinea]